jgi:hypothetical protein
MGVCNSTSSPQDKDNNQRSNVIDKDLTKDRKAFVNEIRLLLLGRFLPFLEHLFTSLSFTFTFPSLFFFGCLMAINDSLQQGAGDSGKSTIAKQMKIIHLKGFTKEERIPYRAIVHSNCYVAMRSVVLALCKTQSMDKLSDQNKVCQTPSLSFFLLSLSCFLTQPFLIPAICRIVHKRRHFERTDNHKATGRRNCSTVARSNHSRHRSAVSSLPNIGFSTIVSNHVSGGFYGVWEQITNVHFLSASLTTFNALLMPIIFQRTKTFFVQEHVRLVLWKSLSLMKLITTALWMSEDNVQKEENGFIASKMFLLFSFVLP